MSSLTDEDIHTLRSIGRDTIKSIVSLCVEAVLWTIYLVLVVCAGNILMFKRRSKMTLIMFLIVLAMFVMDSAICVIDVNNAIKEISYTLTSNSDRSLSDRYSLTLDLPWPAESAIYAFMSNLGDVIVIWRVHAFYATGNDRWLLLIPLAFLAGSFATSGLITFCVVKLVEDPSIGDFVNPPFCKNVQLASYCTTLATTGAATLMISYKTWQYRRTIGRLLRGSNTMTKCERVMAILIESGIVFFLFFLEPVVTDIGHVRELEHSTPGLDFASQVWTYMTSHILGIYPLVILILVHSERSYIENTNTWTSAHFQTSMEYTHSTDSRRYWNNSHSAATDGATRTRPIEVNVHELRDVNGNVSLKSLGDTMDETVGRLTPEGKHSGSVAL
ncbi:hypothetical protein PHLGIDRAFT_20512 [Phlebiopsis gigantea 11061_1 CR5-6]|uniref:G-protein coupled receptors family 1 profile domain-containing protein n=1 Tax=Phlebiopsis gigantea (strain 11061_1 CR5-6) TaxID=745531 RepID=A0A0C3NCC3_PHLG1|nr:hypothetical protein PHLGIDRAFT_20512 [Phlebiopsis gigantea 11061_1 CR5-6]